MTDDIVNAEAKTEYIAINLTSVLYEHPFQIKKLLEDYANKYDIQILWDNKGASGSMKNSYLIIFEDIELTETKLKTDVTCWIAPRAATGYTYTVEKDAGEWTVTDAQFTWIS